MKFKLDENLPSAAALLLREAGHDALRILDQLHPGATDSRIAEVVRLESRILVTLDLDFSDIRAYRPSDFVGIIVLRPHDLSAPSILALLRQVLAALRSEPPDGQLWIVEPHRIRVRRASDSPDE